MNSEKKDNGSKPVEADHGDSQHETAEPKHKEREQVESVDTINLLKQDIALYGF